MYPAGNLTIPVEGGQLEAIIKEPRDFPEPLGAALVLHPHPLHGGTMHNKVVFRAASALNDAGLVTLRINFRGVGASTGIHDDGVGEQDDARAALEYIERTYPGLDLTLAGFSFGSRVGFAVGISDARIKRLIGLGVPVGMYDLDFIKTCRKPALFVHGERDELGQVEDVRRFVTELSKECDIKLVVVPDADHFFEGHLDDMKKAILDWIGPRLAARS